MVTKIAGIKLEKFHDCKVTAGFFRSEFFFFENESSMSYGHRSLITLALQAGTAESIFRNPWRAPGGPRYSAPGMRGS